MSDQLTKDERKALRKGEWQAQMAKEQRKGLFQKIAIWAGVIVLLAAGIWAMVSFAGNGGSQSFTPLTGLPAVTKDDEQTGPVNAKIQLVEYADFQCPACFAYHPVVKQLLKDFNGQIHFIYRFMPLTNIHPHAMISAQAAYAAGKQGKFWEMHDLLFEHQQDWAQANNAEDLFLFYAKQLNLNIPQYETDFNYQKTKDVIQNDEDKAVAIGVNATPTFFINGKSIQNPTDYIAFRQLIKEKLK